MTREATILSLLTKHKSGLSIVQISELSGLSNDQARKSLLDMCKAGKVKRSANRAGHATVWMVSGAIDLPKEPIKKDRIGQAFGKLTRHLGEWIRTWGKA